MGRPKSIKSTPTDYEKLPETRSKNGYLYKLNTRNDKAAVYEQIVEKDTNGIVGQTVGYEVFKVIVGKPYSLVQKFGTKAGEIYSYPAAEKFPSNESFGDWAWAFTTKALAMAKFEEIK